MLPVYPKIIKMPMAENGNKNNIPDTTEESGLFSYNEGFPPITQVSVKAGGKAPQRTDFNGVLNELSQHIFFMQNGGRYAWQADLDYAAGAVVLGSNGVQYKALQNSGVNLGGAKDPTDPLNAAYWTRYEKLDPTGMLQQIAKRSTLGSWTILCEPNKPLLLYLASEDANAMASFLVKKNGETAEKTPILMGMDNITGVQTSNIITILPNEEIVILEVFEISESATIYAYQ